MTDPYFSICIPQYNRTPFLIKALDSIAAQSFRDFEVCISDGGSTDGGRIEIERYLQASNFCHQYTFSDTNLLYDQNLRAAINLSKGQYCFLLGNDDRLKLNSTLADLYAVLKRYESVGAAITNYVELATDQLYQRAIATQDAGTGPGVAARSFRDYSFVSGLILNGKACRGMASDCCDGSEMYQMYLGTRIIASGGRLIYIDQASIEKDIQLPGLQVDSYQCKKGQQLRRKPLPLTRLAETVDLGLALAPGIEIQRRRSLDCSILLQLYLYTYAFWIIEYKRVFGLKHVLWFIRSILPSRTAASLPLGAKEMMLVWVVYIATSSAALLTPVWFFSILRPWLYGLAKRPSKRS